MFRSTWVLSFSLLLFVMLFSSCGPMPVKLTISTLDFVQYKDVMVNGKNLGTLKSYISKGNPSLTYDCMSGDVLVIKATPDTPYGNVTSLEWTYTVPSSESTRTFSLDIPAGKILVSGYAYINATIQGYLYDSKDISFSYGNQSFHITDSKTLRNYLMPLQADSSGYSNPDYGMVGYGIYGEVSGTMASGSHSYQLNSLTPSVIKSGPLVPTNQKFQIKTTSN